MATPHESRRFGRFIQHDPNASRYNRRLSTEEWDRLKPMLLKSFGEGVAYAEIERRLKSDQIHISADQLKRQLRKWGLCPHNQEPSCQPTQTIQSTMSTMLLERSPILQSLQQPVSPPRMRWSRGGQDWSAITAKPNSELDVLSEEMESLRLPEIYDEPQYTRSLEDLASSTYMPMYTAEHREVSDTSTMAIDQHSRNASDFTLCSADVPELEKDMPETVEPFQFSAYRDELRPRALLHVSVRLQLDIPPHKSSDMLQRMWQCLPSETGPFVERLPSLSHMAALLFTLRSFEQAFDAFFLLCHRLGEEVKSVNSLQTYLLFCAIGCARSAYTTEQVYCAKALIVQLRDWLWGCYPSGALDDLRIGMYLHGLRKMAGDLEKESLEETAYWSANTILSCVRDGRPHIADINTLASLWPKGVGRHYNESLYVQASLVHALENFTRCLHCLRNKINALLVEVRLLPEHQIRTTQTLARLVLEHYVASSDTGLRHNYGSEQNSDRPFDQQRPGLFEEHVLIALCFIVVEWSCESCESAIKANHRRPKGRSGFSDLLEQAARRVREAIDGGPGDPKYTQIIELPLKWSGPCEPGSTQRSIASTGLLTITAVLSDTFTLGDLFSHDILIKSTKSPDVANSLRQTAMEGTALQNHDEEASLNKEWLLDPPIAGSARSSRSSEHQSFNALAARIGSSGPIVNMSPRTVSSGKWSEPMSWRFSTVTGFSSGSSVRGSAASDAAMGAAEDYH